MDSDGRRQTPSTQWTRRQLLARLGLASAGLGLVPLARPTRANSRVVLPEEQPRFLIVLCATGGASIIDGPLAVRASECPNHRVLNTFDDDAVKEISGLPFRAVDRKFSSLGALPMPFETRQSDFIRAHGKDMMVACWKRSSVNHQTAQRRALSGKGAWRGRTIQEIVAAAYGRNVPLPNVVMVEGSGYSEHGRDPTVPDWARGEYVADPTRYALSLDGVAGVSGAPPRDLVQLARSVRQDILEPASGFSHVFGHAAALERWRHIRRQRQPKLERADLISQLMLHADSALMPLTQHGLRSSSAAPAVRKVFPGYAHDPLQGQAALAFLLLKYRLSVSVTIGSGFGLVMAPKKDVVYTGKGHEVHDGAVLNPALGFDFAHQGHRATQAFMWRRMMRTADGLIRLLKSEPFGTNGQSLWDRTLIYVATEFGRTKTRPAAAAEFPSAHHTNNGMFCLSPLVNGGHLLGGVDPTTCMTYGFDPKTGRPEKGRNMTEPEIFGGLLQALGIDTGSVGLPDMPSMRRG